MTRNRSTLPFLPEARCCAYLVNPRKDTKSRWLFQNRESVNGQTLEFLTTLKTLLDHIKMKVFIDGGANVGQSIRMFRQYYPMSNEYQVIAIEPFPGNFAKLKALYGNDPRVTLIEGALSNREGRAKFFTGNPLSGSLRVDKKTGGVSADLSIDVVCIDIEKLLLGLRGHRVVLKLDVEGAEYDLIEHMHKTKSLEFVHELFGEWHFGKLADLTESAHISALGQLSDYGLRMKEWEAENEYMEGFVDRRAYWRARKSVSRNLSMIRKGMAKVLRVFIGGN